MRRLRWLVVSLVLLPWRLHADNEQRYPISWEAVPGAGGYRVEVGKESGVPFLSRQVNESKVTFLLAPGEYFFRIVTLNRFLHTEGETEWIPFQVVVVAPPAVVSVVPDRLSTGKAQSVIIEAANLSRKATASVQAPSGTSVAIAVDRLSKSTLRIELPLLNEVGKYTLSLTNPPNLSVTIESAFTVEDNKPAATGLESRPAGGGQMLPAPLLLPLPTLPQAQPVKEVPAVAPPVPPARHVHANLLLSAAWDCLVPGSPWADVYSNSPLGGEIGVGYYAKQGFPVGGTVLYAGIQTSGEYSAYSSHHGSSSWAPSSLAMYSVSLAPSLEADFSFLQIRTSPGGGVVFSSLQGEDASGNGQSVQSIDFFASGRLALDIPVLDFLLIETAAEYRHFFLVTPLDVFSASAGLVLALR